MWTKEINPLQFLGLSNSAANNDMVSKIWTNGDTFIRVENIVGKGKIARYKQFLLFPTMFSKAASC